MVSPGLLPITRASRRWLVTLQFGGPNQTHKVDSVEDAPTALQAIWAAKEKAHIDGASLTGFQVGLADEAQP